MAVGHLKSLVPLLRMPNVEYAPMTGDALVERARSISATYFLRKSDADVHLSIDSDITDFRVEDVLKICEQAASHDIVAAVYITRAAKRTFPATFFQDGLRVEMAFDPTPVPVQWAATGFLAVHRRVFERLTKDLPLLHKGDGDRAFYPFYLPLVYDDPDAGPILLSEDYAFCERAKQAGFGVWINPAVRLGHIGQYVYRLENMLQEELEPHPMVVTRAGRVWKAESLSIKEHREAEKAQVASATGKAAALKGR